ncbi:MAG: HAMP domain-containing histidine kinase [Clostridia bacterium]|nr:HAMP domain-containing histidine kinase [Clostridia bacterium]
MGKTQAVKPNKKRLSLFTKYYIAIAATVIASLLVLGTIFSVFLYGYWQDKSFESLESATENIAALLDSDSLVPQPLSVRVKTETLISSINAYAKMNNCDVVIVDSNNTIVQKSEDCAIEDSEIAADAAAAENSRKAVELHHYSGKVIVANCPIIMGESQVGRVIALKEVNVFFPFIEDILRMFLFSALGSLVISVPVAYYLVYRVYKPISQLKHATEKIGAGDYSFRVEIDGENEFAYLGNAFNSMARDLAALETSRRNFIANISHELKTPMTTIGGYIDAMMDGTIDKDKQDHYLAIVSSEVKRLSRLVVAMLNLSKIEAGERKLEKKNVNLTKMLVEVMISFEQAIESNHIEVLGLDKIGDISANVDRDMMYQVFYNLTDNAVKFTDPGGRIFVSLTTSSGKIGFRIVNECSGISKEDMAKIFERFYKVDRSRNSDIQGFGLGLYITKTIVTMHGGQITARSHEGSDCEFLFWIPAQ